MSRPRILIAGIGNIFLGDDAFGPEVLRRLQGVGLPDHVRLVDFGIRSYDLAYAIADGHDVTILVDATPRGEPAGTLTLLELEPRSLDSANQLPDAHSLNAVAALQFVRTLGFDFSGSFYLAGCEPSTLECEDGLMELSAPVADAVSGAVEMITRLVRRVSAEGLTANPKPAPARPAPRRNQHALHS